MVGSVVGTVEYMAPEQARAEAVDQRADIYAFGLILYDLLLGRIRAQRTDSVLAELQLRMQEPPPAARTVDPTIPAALDRLITRCIQTDPAKRFQTTQDLLGELGKLDNKGVPLPLVRRLTWKMTTAAAVVVAGLVGLTYWAAQGPPPPVDHEPVSILIGDLTNTTGDPALERHAGTDAEARAGRRRLHQRLRPRRHPSSASVSRRRTRSTRPPAGPSPSTRASASCCPDRSRRPAAATA